MSKSDIVYLVLAACSFTSVTSQCPEIELEDAHHKFINGEYNTVDYSLYCGQITKMHRLTYIHEEGAYYMYYDNDHWYVGDDVCGSGQEYARVLSSQQYPENINEIWEERDETSAWVYNEDFDVECDIEPPESGIEEDGLSIGAICGIVAFVLAFIAIILVIIVFVRKRQIRQKANQSQPQVAQHISMQSADSSDIGAELPPAYTNPNYDLTINGTRPGVHVIDDLRFDMAPPSYAEIAVKDPMSSGPYVNASTPSLCTEAFETKKPEK